MRTNPTTNLVSFKMSSLEGKRSYFSGTQGVGDIHGLNLVFTPNRAITRSGNGAYKVTSIAG